MFVFLVNRAYVNSVPLPALIFLLLQASFSSLLILLLEEFLGGAGGGTKRAQSVYNQFASSSNVSNERLPCFRPLLINGKCKFACFCPRSHLSTQAVLANLPLTASH